MDSFDTGKMRAENTINEKMAERFKNAGKRVAVEKGHDIYEWDTSDGKKYIVYAPSTHEYLGEFNTLALAKASIKG